MCTRWSPALRLPPAPSFRDHRARHPAATPSARYLRSNGTQTNYPKGSTISLAHVTLASALSNPADELNTVESGAANGGSSYSWNTAAGFPRPNLSHLAGYLSTSSGKCG